jgi:hypothetical protein
MLRARVRQGLIAVVVTVAAALAAGTWSFAVVASSSASSDGGRSCPSDLAEGFVAASSKAACATADALSPSGEAGEGTVQSVDARGKVAAQPRRFMFTKDVVARDLRWKSWKDTGARAKGKLGGLSRGPMKVRLYLSRATSCESGTLFLEAKLKLPGGIHETRNYDCFC